LRLCVKFPQVAKDSVQRRKDAEMKSKRYSLFGSFERYGRYTQNIAAAFTCCCHSTDRRGKLLKSTRHTNLLLRNFG